MAVGGRPVCGEMICTCGTGVAGGGIVIGGFSEGVVGGEDNGGVIGGA